MRPVDQTIFGDGSDGSTAGNCFAACVASIFECDLDDVPHFCADGDRGGEKWYERLADWLRPRHLYPICLSNCAEWKPSGYAITSGLGPRGFPHSCVSLDGEVVHDPHPSHAGLIEIKDHIIIAVLNPVG